jgi:hypothetical protein
MRKADDGKPLVDATGRGLGVRGAPVNGVLDVDLDDEGKVVLNSKGMSVAPAWRDLPFFLISRRLRAVYPAARGGSDLHCFRLGNGAFVDGPVSEELDLTCDGPKHGVVVPRASVPLDDFQQALANTRDRWVVDEN